MPDPQKLIDDAAKTITPDTSPTPPVSSGSATPPPQPDAVAPSIGPAINPSPTPTSPEPPPPSAPEPVPPTEIGSVPAPTPQPEVTEKQNQVMDALLGANVPTTTTATVTQTVTKTVSPPTPPTIVDESTESTPPPQQPKRSKRGILAAVILLLAVTIPLSAYFVSQRQQLADVRSRAAGGTCYGTLSTAGTCNAKVAEIGGPKSCSDINIQANCALVSGSCGCNWTASTPPPPPPSTSDCAKQGFDCQNSAKTCTDKGGKVKSNFSCTDSSSVCCDLDNEPPPPSCVGTGGTCKPFTCGAGETKTSDACTINEDHVCCKVLTPPPPPPPAVGCSSEGGTCRPFKCNLPEVEHKNLTPFCTNINPDNVCCKVGLPYTPCSPACQPGLTCIDGVCKGGFGEECAKLGGICVSAEQAACVGPNCKYPSICSKPGALDCAPGGETCIKLCGPATPTPTKKPAPPPPGNTPTPTKKPVTDPPEPPPVAGQCKKILVLKGILPIDPKTIKPGDQVTLGVVATNATKGRIRVNGGPFKESTTKIIVDGQEVFTVPFAVPPGILTFTLEAEVFTGGVWK